MKLLIRTLLTGLFAYFLSACTADMGDEAYVEQNLVVAVSPDPGTTMAHALGSSYDFKTLVTSRLPRGGVTVTVTYRQDSDGVLVFSKSYSITQSPLDVTITGIPFNEVGTVTVTVTSNKQATNTATKTFKLVKK